MAVSVPSDSTYRTALGTAVIADAVTAYWAAVAGKPQHVIDAEAEAAFQAALAAALAESEPDSISAAARSPAASPSSALHAVQRQPRRASLARAIKQAQKAGLNVRGARLVDGEIVLEFGEPASADVSNALDEWIAKHAH
jgi:hypothetical protein